MGVLIVRSSKRQYRDIRYVSEQTSLFKIMENYLTTGETMEILKYRWRSQPVYDPFVKPYPAYTELQAERVAHERKPDGRSSS